jgi:hypothetical protein
MITLIPLGVFIYLYLKLQVVEINSLLQGPNQILIAQITIFGVALAILTSVHLVINRKMKKLSHELSLGNKMDRYFYYSIIRMGVGALMSVVMGAGLYLTGSEVFSVFFLVILLWMAYHWPIPKKLCNELILKGDEREMVLYRRESFN